jgi:DNA-directed RNA polymerase subunit M/transcription elongation factor TFIIS
MLNSTCPACGSAATGYEQQQVRNGVKEYSVCDECGHTWGHRTIVTGRTR